jgi:hypothetical protein
MDHLYKYNWSMEASAVKIIVSHGGKIIYMLPP